MKDLTWCRAFISLVAQDILKHMIHLFIAIFLISFIVLGFIIFETPDSPMLDKQWKAHTDSINEYMRNNPLYYGFDGISKVTGFQSYWQTYLKTKVAPAS
jgi:hypothetical protein